MIVEAGVFSSDLEFSMEFSEVSLAFPFFVGFLWVLFRIFLGISLGLLSFYDVVF